MTNNSALILEGVYTRLSRTARKSLTTRDGLQRRIFLVTLLTNLLSQRMKGGAR